MRHRSNNKKTALLFLVIWVVILLAVTKLGYSSTRSAVRIGYVGSETPSYWSGSYYSLNGTMEKTIRPKNGKLTIQTETQEGSLSVTVTDDKGEVLFQEQDMGTKVEQLAVEGKVRIRLIAKKHQGSFEIDGREP